MTHKTGINNKIPAINHKIKITNKNKNFHLNRAKIGAINGKNKHKRRTHTDTFSVSTLTVAVLV